MIGIKEAFEISYNLRDKEAVNFLKSRFELENYLGKRKRLCKINIIHGLVKIVISKRGSLIIVKASDAAMERSKEVRDECSQHFGP